MSWKNRATPIVDESSSVPSQSGHWKDRAVYSDQLTDTAPNNDVSYLESLLRGGAQGATLGFSDELTGGLEAAGDAISNLDLSHFMDNYRTHRDEARQANKQAEEANPGTYLTGNIAGGVGTALLTGGASAAGRGAITLGQLATEGALLGGAAGLGGSEADVTKGELAQAAIDTTIGAGIGGVLPVALNKTGKAGAKLYDTLKEAPLVGRPIKGLEMGLRGKGWLTAGGQKEITDEMTEQSSNFTKEIAAGLKSLGNEANELEQKALASGVTIDIKEKGLETIQKLKDIKAQAQSKEADAVIDAEIDRITRFIGEADQKVITKKVTPIPSKELKPATQSNFDEAVRQADLETKALKKEGLPGRVIVESLKDDEGNIIGFYKKTISMDEGFSDSVQVKGLVREGEEDVTNKLLEKIDDLKAKDAVEGVEASYDIIDENGRKVIRRIIPGEEALPIQTGPRSITPFRPGKPAVMSEASELVEPVETLIPNENYGRLPVAGKAGVPDVKSFKSGLATGEDKMLTKELYPAKTALGNLRKSAAEAADTAVPGMADNTDKFHSIYQALEAIGLDKDMMRSAAFDKKAELEVKNTITQLMNKLDDTNIKGSAAAADVKLAVDYLSKVPNVDIEKINVLLPKIQKAVEDYKFMKQVSKSSQGFAAPLSLLAAGTNLTGQGINKIANIGGKAVSKLPQSIQNMAKKTAGKSPYLQSSTRAMMLNDSESSPEKVSKDASFAENDDLLARVNRNTNPQLQPVADRLKQAIEAGDSISKNAALNILLQTPEGRQLLKGE